MDILVNKLTQISYVKLIQKFQLIFNKKKKKIETR